MWSWHIRIRMVLGFYIIFELLHLVTSSNPIEQRRLCVSQSASRGQRRDMIATGNCGHVPVGAVCEWRECTSQSQWSLTVNPADTNRLEYGHEQQTHPAGGVRIKELEDVHPALIGRDRCQFGCQRRTSFKYESVWKSETGLETCHKTWMSFLGRGGRRTCAGV